MDPVNHFFQWTSRNEQNDKPLNRDMLVVEILGEAYDKLSEGLQFYKHVRNRNMDINNSMLYTPLFQDLQI